MRSSEKKEERLAILDHSIQCVSDNNSNGRKEKVAAAAAASHCGERE